MLNHVKILVEAHVSTCDASNRSNSSEIYTGVLRSYSEVQINTNALTETFLSKIFVVVMRWGHHFWALFWFVE